MNKPYSYKLLKNIDVSNLVDFSEKYRHKIDTNTDFNTSYGREKCFIDCNSYPIIDNFIINDIQLHEIFFDTFDEIINLFYSNYGPGNFCKIQFSNLKSFGKIKTHYDGGLVYLWSHRIHIPIITNEKVIFNVDGIRKNIKLGEIVEVNNNKMHSVKNGGNQDRIHLILDYMPNEYYEIFSELNLSHEH